MKSRTISFNSARCANHLVAGVPCAARLVRHMAKSGQIGPAGSVVLAIEDGGLLSAQCETELARLAPDIAWQLAGMNAPSATNAISAYEVLSQIAGAEVSSDQRAIAAASRAIIAATGKTTDGVVSRFMNRPISQAISSVLLRLSFVRPIHATIFAGVIGLAMALCLLFGGEAGLIPAAILFQCASIIDGVDGEIARATFRTSKLGATLDTATDAATNFAFIGGVAYQLWHGGEQTHAIVGIAGLSILIAGLTILGLRSMRAGGGLSFDAVKADAHKNGSGLMLVLAKITSRDFYVLALAILVAAGLGGIALVIFAIAAFIWFGFVLFTLLTGKPAAA